MADSEARMNDRERDGPATEPERDGNVRAIARGLAVLQVINRGGSVSMMQISRGAGLPYPTATRIVQTLIEEGMVEREPARKRYRPTALVRTLSAGYRDEDDLVAVARPLLVELTRQLLWPVSLATRVGAMMMVRDSTHQLTSLTLHNYAPGYTLPMVECASGKAYLAWAEPEELAMVMAGLGQGDRPAERMGRLLLADGSLLGRIRAQGYATQARNPYTATPGKTSSIAAPVFRGERVAGAISLIFFAAAMPMREAEARYAPPLLGAAQRISALLAA
jgi:IclR family mhp operon transcriptional activator